MESISEINNTGKGRPEGTTILSKNAKTFKNVLDGVKAAGTAEKTVSGTANTLDSIFKKAASTYGIPEKILKAVAKTESDFQVTAVSKAGAMGIMQLMPATAKELGVSDPFNPEQNIMGGAKLLASNLKEFGGDLKLALAAYNAGPGNVKRCGGKIPPYAETKRFVNVIMQDYQKLKKNPDPAIAKIKSQKKISLPERKTEANTAPIDFELPKLNEIPEIKNSDPVMEIL
jgi:soluble lytic murein transglycosylase-like protein